MEQENNLQRNLGITLSVIVACAVVFVTIIFNKSSSSPVTTLADQNSSSSSSLDLSSQNPVSPSSQIPVSNSKTHLGSSEESGEGSGGDDGSVPSTPAKTPVVTTMPPATVPKQTTAKATSVYKNGTYSATGSYMSPGGYDQVGVTLTLANDIITDVSVTPMAGDHTSSRYQSRFISGYKQYVVGKNIASVNLTNVSGASLTPIGFNDALAQIKAQAKA